MPKENPQVGNNGLGAKFVSGAFVLLTNCYRKACFPYEKSARGEERAGSDVRFRNFAAFSKKVIRIKCCPERRSACGNERGGSDFRFWNFAVSQKMCSEWNFAPKEKPKVGTSGSVAALVS